MGEGVQRVMTIDDDGGGVQNALKFDDVIYGRTDEQCKLIFKYCVSKLSPSRAVMLAMVVMVNSLLFLPTVT
jgi:hypothetical protein